MSGGRPLAAAQELRKALEGLEGFLGREYARGSVFYEADIHHLTVEHLRRRLGRRWIVGSKHKIWGRFPDIVCYRLPRAGDPVPLVAAPRPEAFLEAILELKYRSWLRRDLQKMSALQGHHRRRTRRPLVAWMVFGDHFNPKVHRANYAIQLSIEAAIRRWEAADPVTRGCTILRFGIPDSSDGRGERRTRLAFNRHWWYRDDDPYGERG